MSQGMSELFWQKQTRMFLNFDFRGENRNYYADIESVFDTFVDFSGSWASNRRDELREDVFGYFDDVFQGSPYVDGLGFIEPHIVMLHNMKTDPSIDKKLREYLFADFRMIDKDGDEMWSEADFAQFMKLKFRGTYSPEGLTKLFGKLDTDGDQLISFSQLHYAVGSFFFDQDPGPADSVMGKVPPFSKCPC